LKNVTGIMAGCIVPHPPLLIPAIGGRDREKVKQTYQAMEKLAVDIAELSPDVLVMISPHSPMYRDAFTVKTGTVLQGSFSQFACPQVRIAKNNDLELAEAIIESAGGSGLPLEGISAAAGRFSAPGEELDHGLLVPLFYLDQAFETPIVCLSFSGLGYADHLRLGKTAEKACAGLGRRAVFVASGDLSHRLIQGAPAGYSPQGKVFDNHIVDISSRGGFNELTDLDEEMVEAAGECGLRSIYAMWGALQNGGLISSVLSYEGPFGVGYLVSLQLKDDGGE
jgi:MEMO1 family protein